MPSVVSRTAERRDIEAIARLLPDLGYDGSAAEVSRRIARLSQWPENEVSVASVEGEVVGLCHVQGVPLLATDGYAEVQALVVLHLNQGHGIGKQLLAQAVTWSAAHGYMRVRLRSGLHREHAHLFYESQGFIRSKASHAFEFTLKNRDA